MCRTILLAHEVNVVCSHDLDAVLVREAVDAGIGHLLALIYFEGEAWNLGLVALHLEVIILSEYSLVPLHGLAGGVPVVRHQCARYLARQAGRAADEPLMVFLNDLVRDTWLAVIRPLDMACRDYLHEVTVARGILGKEDKVIIRPVGGILEPVVVVPRDIYLASDDGLDLIAPVSIEVLPSHLEELFHAVHIAMVGNSNRGHAQLYGTFEKLPHVGEAVEDGILCMDVKMYEGHMWRFEKQR